MEGDAGRGGGKGGSAADPRLAVSERPHTGSPVTIRTLDPPLHEFLPKREELKRQKAIVLEAAEEVLGKEGSGVTYLIGTMIEVPRGAVTADEIAKEAEFFSFGTNDLTQMGFGLSRDDAGKFLLYYQEHGLLEKDPFITLDASGVGLLVEIGVKKGRSVKPKLKIGVCGEHGGDPGSIRFFHKVGLDYVSCSPYRVPIARLAAAQAQLEQPVSD